MGERGGQHLLSKLLELHEQWSLKSEFAIAEV
jgi:predicted metal-binding protein